MKRTKNTPCQLSLLTSLKLGPDGRPEPFGKVFRIDETGAVHSETHASVVRASFVRMEVQGLEGLAELMLSPQVDTSSCLIYGVHPTLTNGVIDSQDGIRRTDENFPRRAGFPGIFHLDLDDQPERGLYTPDTVEGVEALLRDAVPWLMTARHFYLPSSSSGVVRADGTPVSPKNGWRAYFMLDDSAQAPRVGHEVVAAMFRAGHGKVVVNVSEGRSVARLWRCVVDDSVWSPSKPDFCFGARILTPGLAQRRAATWF
jgi:hypothetical protein